MENHPDGKRPMEKQLEKYPTHHVHRQILLELLVKTPKKLLYQS